MNPVPGATRTARFKQPGARWSLGWHTGEDLAAPVGTPVYTATHGKVIAANAYDTSYGYKVIVQLIDGEEYWYCHMPKDAATVKVGDLVEAGQRIGAVGMTGNTTGPHCHIERRRAGAKFAADSFRDPDVGFAFTPRPLRYQSVNCADNNATGVATRTARRARLLTDILRPGAHVTVLQEAPIDGIHKWLRANIDDRPRGRKQGQRLIAGASGRYLWGASTVKLIAKGKTVPSIKGGDGHDKPFTWALVRIDRYRTRLVVNVHGPFGISYKRKRAYWREVFTKVETLRKWYGLDRWQVVLGGDTNGPKAARVEAKRYGYRDARLIARKVTNGAYATTNGWRVKLRRGRRVDLWFVDESVTVHEYRNVKPRPNAKGDRPLIDHNRQVLITA